MEALRIVLFQNSANYKKEETVENKMTYPLPPYSTIIGAIHNACGFQNYHPMELSVQGRFESLIRKPYTDYCFLNTTQDDRGILVKMKNENLLSTAFDKVASAKKSQGNSFRTGTTIQVISRELIQEYRDLKDLNDRIQEFKELRIKPIQELIKKRKKTLAVKKSKLSKESLYYDKVVKREDEINKLKKDIEFRLKEYEENQYKKPISRFRTLTTSLKYYEILTNVELIIHIKSDSETIDCIKEHVYDIKSIGRSEDFVDVKEVRIVELQDSIPNEMESPYSAYIDYELIKSNNVYSHIRKGIAADGTKYHLNKNYKVEGGKRLFNKKKVIYTSRYCIDEESSGIYIDATDVNKPYIVNLI